MNKMDKHFKHQTNRATTVLYIYKILFFITFIITACSFY